MATADDYAAWIVRNQAKKGTPEFATVAAAYAEAKQEESTPKPKPQETSFGERLKGLGEAALTSITAPVGLAVGGLNALNAAGGNIAKFAVGRSDFADLGQAFEEPMQALTYAPRTETGQAILKTTADATAPLPGLGGELAMIARAGQLARPAAQISAQAIKPAATQALQQVKPAITQAVESVKSKIPGSESSFGKGTVSAAETPDALYRRELAAQMPVPYTGKSGLTQGQASRSGPLLQEEDVLARRGDIPAAQLLRDQKEAQNQVTLNNFDWLANRGERKNVDLIPIGKSVDQALVNKYNVVKRRVKAAYDAADEAGELEAPVALNSVPKAMDDAWRYEGVTGGLVKSISDEGQRLGVLAASENGFVPAQTTARNAETFLQYINDATDWTDGRQARIARSIKDAIDADTATISGDLYRKARGMRVAQAREFENTAITAKLLSTKGKTSERQIALEDVFDRVMLKSSVEERNKLRRTLLNAGPEGKQAWTDLKGKLADDIIKRSLSDTKDSQGNPIVLPSQLSRNIRALSEDGTLESVYGKRTAQTFTDLAEIVSDMKTVPPNLVNSSGTANAVAMAVSEMALTGLLTGVPAPYLTAIKEGTKYVKNKKTATRIRQLIEQPEGYKQ